MFLIFLLFFNTIAGTRIPGSVRRALGFSCLSLAPQGVGCKIFLGAAEEGCEMSEIVRAVCFNANGLTDEGKRKMVVESCINGRVDILGLSETHMNGVGVAECGTGGDDGLWEGMVGGVV